MQGQTQSADPGRRAQSSYSYVESKICFQFCTQTFSSPQPQNPKSKIPKTPKIQNSKSPNLRRWAPHIKICYITVQNPRSKIPTIQNPKSPKSKIPKIQNPKSPKSKIPKIQNPQNPKSPAKLQNLGRWGLHIKNCYITIQNPKSQIPKIQNLGILDFGFGGFWILDFGDFGFGGFWILHPGDFGFWILGILDFGDFGAFGEVQGMYH